MAYAPAPVTYGMSPAGNCYCGCADGCGDDCSASCCDGCNACDCRCMSCPGCCIESAPGRCHMTMTILFSILAGIAFIFYIVATATKEWTTGFRVTAGPYRNHTVSLGLWEFCSESFPGCGELESLNHRGVIEEDSDLWSKYQTVRAFSILAIIFTFIAWLFNFFFMCRFVMWLKWLILSTGFIGVFSGLIAMSVWVSLDNDLDTGETGYSLGLEAAGWPILFIGCLLLWFVDYGVVIAGGFAPPPVALPPPPPPASLPPVSMTTISNTVAYPPPPSSMTPAPSMASYATPYPTSSYTAAYSSQPYQPY